MLVLVALVAFVACGDRPPPPDSEAVAGHMAEHFARADDVHMAIVRGDLARAREPARWLAEHAALPGLPEEWQPHLPAMREAAKDLDAATDLIAAAKATARLGEACGNCHAALGAELKISIDEALPEGGTAADHMRRHAWAAGRLWDGLVLPSGEVWQSGAKALDEVPLVPEELTDAEDRLVEARVTAERVHELGITARQAGDATSRTAVYGEFLSTCARCHADTGAEAI